MHWYGCVAETQQGAPLADGLRERERRRRRAPERLRHLEPIAPRKALRSLFGARAGDHRGPRAVSMRSAARRRGRGRPPRVRARPRGLGGQLRVGREARRVW